jgi:phosphoribosyl-AMP cyclohydrolase / phosphoribosyl-ATP pyrophosphohydrolase
MIRLLIQVKPEGPTCHTGARYLLARQLIKQEYGFISELEKTIKTT